MKPHVFLNHVTYLFNTCDFKPRGDTFILRAFSYLEENPLGAEVLDDEVRGGRVDVRAHELRPAAAPKRRDLAHEEVLKFRDITLNSEECVRFGLKVTTENIPMSREYESDAKSSNNLALN